MDDITQIIKGTVFRNISDHALYYFSGEIIKANSYDTINPGENITIISPPAELGNFIAGLRQKYYKIKILHFGKKGIILFCRNRILLLHSFEVVCNVKK